MSSAVSSHAVGRYHPLAVALHWLLGLALVGLFVLGLYMTDLPFSPQRLKLYNWHKWAGMLVLALSFWRLAWRWWHRPPALPAAIAQAMPAWQRLAHHATHLGLYLTFFAIPLLGWAYSSAAGFQVVLWGVLPLPNIAPTEPALAEALKPWHGWAAYAMAALVLLHVGGALKHAFIDRDGLLQRMGLGRA